MALIVLDAGVLIGFLDGDDAHHHGSRAVLASAVAASDDLALPASALAETLVGPSRRGPDEVARVLDLMTAVPVAVVPVDVEIATTAAKLRAEHRSVRLPDALVVATAIVTGADRLVTTDRGWPDAEDLGLQAEISHP